MLTLSHSAGLLMTTGIDGAAGDSWRYDYEYDDTDCDRLHYGYEQDNTDSDEEVEVMPEFEYSIVYSSDRLEELKEDIRRFGDHKEVPVDLYWFVGSPIQTQKLWYEELLKEPEPIDPEHASRLVCQIMDRVHPYGSAACDDVVGFWRFYGLPHCNPKPSASGEALSVWDPDWDDYLPPPPNAPAFTLRALPVDESKVTDGAAFMVNVEVEDKNWALLPARIQALYMEDRSEAHKQQAAVTEGMGDYEVVPLSKGQVLTRKYHIRLRGICVPEIGTPAWTNAKEELVKIVAGRHLEISVYYIDEEARWVGDVYHRDKSLQELLLKKGAASGYWTEDAPGVEKKP